MPACDCHSLLNDLAHQPSNTTLHLQAVKSIHTHGGNLRAITDESGLEAGSILDFSANINPLGPIPEFLQVINNTITEAMHYPDPEYAALTQSICTFGDWDRATVVAANGASELLYAAAKLTCCKRALIPVPSYSDYTEAALRAGLPVKHLLCNEQNRFIPSYKSFTECILPGDIVFLGRPANPTGSLIDINTLCEIISHHKNSFFVIDESFIEFSDSVSIADRTLPDNVIMIRSMTKFYAIPGLRLGYAVAHPQIIMQLRAQLTPWSINCFAASVGIASLENKTYQCTSRNSMTQLKNHFRKELESFPELRVYPSESNFFLIKLNINLTGSELYRLMLKHHIAIRTCSNFTGLDDHYIRIAVRSGNENTLFVKSLRQIFQGGTV